MLTTQQKATLKAAILADPDLNAFTNVRDVLQVLKSLGYRKER